MQAIGIFAIFLVFVGACMIEGFKGTQKNCPCTLEDRKLFVDCLNKTKEGDCNFEAFIADPKNYMNKEEQRMTAKCIAEGKNYITEEGNLDETRIIADIKESKTTEDIQSKLIEAYYKCCEEEKNSDDVVADICICCATEGYEICSEK